MGQPTPLAVPTSPYDRLGGVYNEQRATRSQRGPVTVLG